MRILLAALVAVPIASALGVGDTWGDFDRIKRNAVMNDMFKLVGPQAPDAEECPPCFNCNLPNFECTQFSRCNQYTGMCECRDGYGGMDCSSPLCGGLADGNKNRPVRNDTDICICKEGWGGINCNICQQDSVCDPFMPEGLEGTCYTEGIVLNKFHSMCDVTNRKIVEILQGMVPQATFSCDKEHATCDFQFWIDQRESFYCDLDGCTYEYDVASNSTKYNCDNVACRCLPDKMLCGEAGSIDISEFLTESIKGPGFFSCDIDSRNCRFSEPAMNDLITQVFGDPYITLGCYFGECVHKSEIPGYGVPDLRSLTLGNVLLILSVVVVMILVVFAMVKNVSRSPFFKKSTLSTLRALGEEGSEALTADSVLATLAFDNIGYQLGASTILSGVSGVVRPHECLAIMGGSGAGKTTLLDILAGKNKQGDVTGAITVNGAVVGARDFRKIVGFVDQEDHLIPTLTVYETVLNSALLRLLRTLPLRAKEARVIEVLNELRILAIKDRVVGSDFSRGISGGEKRRVSIACELVTSPSILFLDEPTSGLDAYNARNVVESLVRLSRDYQRTVVFTIHQPRSNIVSLFDKLLLLAEGQLVYSGDMIKCNDYFARNGYRCPLGYNIADYLIDITLDGEAASGSGGDTVDIHEEFVRGRGSEGSDADPTREWEHYAVHRDDFNHDREASVDAAKGSSQGPAPLGLASLFRESYVAAELAADISEVNRTAQRIVFKDDAFKRASFFDQFLILSSRTFKNLYRNPRLLMGHYLLSLVMGLFCGYLYYDVSYDISGFQNRLGLIFFVLALFGFSALTGLHSFSSERIIFIRERANNYYHPLSYYLSKMVCDIVPLRVFPPIILISVVYPLVGLTMDHNGFLKCILVLVLFNVAVTVETLIVGVLIGDPGTSTMVGVLVLLFSLLFAGLFINGEELREQAKWLQWVSVFHYAYEALSINEVRDLILREKKYGLSIEVPGAVILNSFGFDVLAFWRDVSFLGGLAAAFLVVGYVFLHVYMVEKR